MPPHSLGPTVISCLKRPLPQPNKIRAICALGTPIKAVAFDVAMHVFKCLTPIPGSIKTGMTPILNNANVIASGGISNVGDIKDVKEKNPFGVILGKALYENKISIEEAKKV